MAPTDAELFYPTRSEAPAPKPAEGSSAPPPDLVASDPTPAPQEPQPTKTEAEIFYPKTARTEQPTAETGAYELQMPDGVTLDTELLAAATPVLRDLGLSNEQASKLAPLASIVQERMWTEMANDHAQVRADWMREAKADTNIGGANWNETIRIAKGALTEGGAGPGSEVLKLLNQTGLGDHPAFISLFRNIGMKLSGASASAHSRGGSW